MKLVRVTHLVRTTLSIICIALQIHSSIQRISGVCLFVCLGGQQWLIIQMPNNYEPHPIVNINK